MRPRADRARAGAVAPIAPIAVGVALAVASSVALAAGGCAVDHEGDDPVVVPPVEGAESIEAWFATGAWKGWQCESSSHPAFDPSPHGHVRVCANPIAHAAAGTAGEYPPDASMLLLVDRGGVVSGFGAQRHTSAGSGADSWYWYLRVPEGSATVHDATGLAADGWGFEGPAKDYCGACHGLAGHDHPGHDFLWTVP